MIPLGRTGIVRVGPVRSGQGRSLEEREQEKKVGGGEAQAQAVWKATAPTLSSSLSASKARESPEEGSLLVVAQSDERRTERGGQGQRWVDASRLAGRDTVDPQTTSNSPVPWKTKWQTREKSYR